MDQQLVPQEVHDGQVVCGREQRDEPARGIKVGAEPGGVEEGGELGVVIAEQDAHEL